MDQRIREIEATAVRPTAGDGAFGHREKPAGDGGGVARTRSPRSWRQIFIAIFKAISEDRILLVAAGVTFYAILALFPAISALVSIYGLFADPTTIAGHLDTLSGVAPGGAVEVLRDQLARLAQQNGTALTVGFAISLVIAFWFANSGMTALFEALNVTYEEKERRSWLKFYAMSFLFTAGAIVLGLVSIAIIVAIPVVLNYLPSASLTAALLDIARWPLLFVLVTGALSIAYRYAPCRSAPQWRSTLISAASAAVVWLGVSAVFSWYVANFGSYNKTYGSLGAIFGFMTWMWLSMVVVLLGAKLDDQLSRRAEESRKAGRGS